MELAELIALRPRPAGGVLVTLTRRCPMSCAHCSTASTMETREEPDPVQLLAFTDSFTPADRPEVLLLTGGEPLLLPETAARLARSARAAGTRTALLSGMFFARSRKVPDRLLNAVAELDHFSASLDAHHEREVERAAVFRALRAVRETGVAVSFHLTGTGPDDPYLADVTRAVDREFGGTVPALVNEVRAVGRAAAWAGPARTTGPAAGPGGDPGPCAMAAWPVVAFDGTVLACCNQDVVDRRPAPAHLRLGHVAGDDWATVRRRALESPVLRMIRTVGPVALRSRYAPGAPGAAVAPRTGSSCGDCRALGSGAGPAPEVVAVAGGAAGALLDATAARRAGAAGPVALVRRYGCAAYAPLVVARGPAAPAAPAVGGADERSGSGAGARADSRARTGPEVSG
ncbi:radical SAM protein [Streptomyces sp. LP05-1]|uniref:Radical SAM protein n=1 Tax=Streptomyces pyxinae TaxID=2970734 RepID=A0ABT2CH34_9ACTN|nr:radical SAM protein [Streptomyces sp. LP05-1]MCS0636711.1 radical SAM protein [Streptomyces sp. LP05-1]